MATEYIVEDRTTAANHSIQIDDGEIKWTGTVDAASSEPIFLDTIDGVTYWKLFIDDGEIGVESTVTVQDDDVTLEDVTTATNYRLKVGDGELYWESVSAGGFVPRLPLLGVG